MIDLTLIFEEVYSREHVIQPDVESISNKTIEDATRSFAELVYEQIKDEKYASYGLGINAAAIFSKATNEVLLSAIADKTITDEQISKELGFEYKKYGEASYHPNGHAEALVCIEAKQKDIDPKRCYVIVVDVRRFKDPFKSPYPEHPFGKKRLKQIQHAIDSKQIDPFSIKALLSTPCNNCHHCLNHFGFFDVYFTGKSTLPQVKLFKLSGTKKNRDM